MAERTLRLPHLHLPGKRSVESNLEQQLTNRTAKKAYISRGDFLNLIKALGLGFTGGVILGAVDPYEKVSRAIIGRNFPAVNNAVEESSSVFQPEANVASSRSAENDPIASRAFVNYNRTLDWFRNQDDQYLQKIPDYLTIEDEGESLAMWIDAQQQGRFAVVGSNLAIGGKLKVLLAINGFGAENFDEKSLLKAAQDMHTAFYELQLANSSDPIRYQRDQQFHEEIHQQAEQLTQAIFLKLSK